MPTITQSFTLSANHATRLLAACRAEFGQVDNGDGTFRDITQAEVEAELKRRTLNAWKDLVLRSEREAAKKAAEDGVTPIDLT